MWGNLGVIVKSNFSSQTDGSVTMENGIVQVHLDTMGRVTSILLMSSKR